MQPILEFPSKITSFSQIFPINYDLSPVLPGDEARHGRRRGSWPRGANKGRGREGNSEQQVASGRGLGKPMETHGKHIPFKVTSLCPLV